MLHGSETWLMRAQGLERILVFDHRCKLKWHNCLSNSEVKRMVLGPRIQSSEQTQS